MEEDDNDIVDAVTGTGTGMRTKNGEICAVKIQHHSIKASTVIECLGLVERVIDTVAMPNQGERC